MALMATNFWKGPTTRVIVQTRCMIHHWKALDCTIILIPFKTMQDIYHVLKLVKNSRLPIQIIQSNMFGVSTFGSSELKD